MQDKVSATTILGVEGLRDKAVGAFGVLGFRLLGFRAECLEV